MASVTEEANRHTVQARPFVAIVVDWMTFSGFRSWSAA